MKTQCTLLLSLGRPAVAALALASCAATAGLSGQQCPGDLTSPINCTANDLGIDSVEIIGLADPCTGPGDTATVSATITLGGSGPDRYDVGIHINQEGGDPSQPNNGICFREALFPVAADLTNVNRDSGIGPYADLDGAFLPLLSDACGDRQTGFSLVRSLVDGDIASNSTTPAQVSVSCVDNDGDGFVDVGWMVTWAQNRQTICSSLSQIDPGTASKCEVGRGNIDIRVTSDFGDAPASYGTTGPDAASNGVGVVHLGPAIDAEGDGQPSLNADGDDLNGSTPDDEDGVTIPALLTAGQQAIVPVDPTGNGVFSAWFDWNQDGDFSGPNEAVFVNSPITDIGQTVNFSVNVPATALPGTTYARFRYTAGTTGSPNSESPIGPALEGEVEDYIVTVENNNRDYGDAPDTYGTTIANNGASNIISNVCGLSQQRYPDAETDGQPTTGADGDDLTAGVPSAPSPDDEEGVLLDGNDPSQAAVNVTAGQDVSLIVETFGCGDGDGGTTTDAVVSAWIDWNRNGTFEASEAVLVDQPVNDAEPPGTPTARQYTVAVPATAVPGQSYIRVRLTDGTGPSTNSGSPTGPAGVGEVEDHPLTIINNNLDFGDLPNPYPTTLADNGPGHTLSPNLFLGTEIDAELDGQPTSDADGDDNNPSASPDDEDGVVFTLSLSQIIATVTVTSISGDDFTVFGWIDLNQDDALDPSAEGQGLQGSSCTHVPSTTRYACTLSWSNLQLQRGESYYARVRVVARTTASVSPVGLEAGGEVEDYKIDIGTTLAGIERFAVETDPETSTPAVTWDTRFEVGTLAFHIERLDVTLDDYVMVNIDPIPSLSLFGDHQGGTYRYLDTEVWPGETHTYRLIEIERAGDATAERIHGPYTVTVDGPGWGATALPPAAAPAALDDAPAAEDAQRPGKRQLRDGWLTQQAWPGERRLHKGERRGDARADTNQRRSERRAEHNAGRAARGREAAQGTNGPAPGRGRKAEEAR